MYYTNGLSDYFLKKTMSYKHRIMIGHALKNYILNYKSFTVAKFKKS